MYLIFCSIVIFLSNYNIKRKHFYFTIFNCRLFHKNCMLIFNLDFEWNERWTVVYRYLTKPKRRLQRRRQVITLALVVTNVTKKGGLKPLVTYTYMRHRDLLYTADYMFMTGVRKSWSSGCRTNEFRAYIYTYILYKTTNGRL